MLPCSLLRVYVLIVLGANQFLGSILGQIHCDLQTQ